MYKDTTPPSSSLLNLAEMKILPLAQSWYPIPVMELVKPLEKVFTPYACQFFSSSAMHLVPITVVSRIYAPGFATLALFKSVGAGGLYTGSDISREYAPSSGATPRC